ncbi:MAG: hypothetical protein M3154_10820, partial [Candidatus Eremiobacteraeota bacterium]|nr:hypothetical protein [Candidatus Eremiobacteraeota bacterium]
PASLACLVVPAQSAASEYVVIAANASTTPDVTWSYTLTSDHVGSVSGSMLSGVPLPDLIAAPLARSFSLASVDAGFSDRMESRRRAAERALPISAARSIRPAAPSSTAPGRLSSIMPGGPSLGDVLTLTVPDTITPCTKFFTIGARVMAVSEHAVIVQDTTAPTGGFSSSDFTDIATEFDNVIYPTDTLHFGSPGDIDFNGHILILYTPRVNAETPRGSSSFLGGFFFGGDLFPRATCGQSNIGEIFYLLAPDPGAVFSDARTTTLVRQQTRGVIAHEFQHMINLATRIRTNASNDEVVWLNEALSHFAEELVGRAEKGYSDTRLLTIDDIADFPALNDYNAFFNQNLQRYKLWLRHPADSGATSKHADQSLAVRGAAWSLLRYSADQYASGDVAGFTRRLVAGPDTGVANLVKRSGVSFDEIMQGWMPANYTSGLTIAGLPSRYTYTSWNMRSVENAISSGVYPLRVTDLADAFTISTKSISGGGGYYRVASAGASTAFAVKFRSSDGSVVSDANARVYIVRTK